MTWTATLTTFTLGVALAAPIPPPPPADRGPLVAELRRLVEQREMEAAAAKDAPAVEAALSAARSRLAHAEGKNALAATEGRKVVRYHEGQLKALLADSGRLCSAEPLECARGEVAVARAWVAEVENSRAELRAELPKVITHYEQRIGRYRDMQRHAVIGEVEAQESIKKFGEEVRRARERLAAVSNDAVGPDKAGKSGKQ